MTKDVKYFMMANCPYCVQADRWIEELKNENEAYRAIEMEITDERFNMEYAEQFDYYYVPTFYVDGVKIHEGAATKEKIRAVLDMIVE